MVAPKKTTAARPQRPRRRRVCLLPLLLLVAAAVFRTARIPLPAGGGGLAVRLFDASLFEPRNATDLPHAPAPNATESSSTTTTSAPPEDVAAALHTSSLRSEARSFRIVREDVSVANETVFSLDRFSSKPECTPGLSPGEVRFTLTTQLSESRLWIMKHQCERWPAPLPISLAVYLPPEAPPGAPDRLLERIGGELGCGLSRMHLTILRARSSAPRRYPVNALRNLAIAAVETTHAVYIDSDFLISDGLHGDLLGARPVLANDTRAAVVVPAFEYFPGCRFRKQAEAVECLASEWKTSIPRDQKDLLALLDREDPPRVERGFQKIGGKNRFHGTTMYKTWIDGQEEVIPIPCVKTWVYEPYLAFRVCEDLPLFPEVFRGWGFNKMVWVKILLKKLGYRLWQLPKGFVVHVPHELSESRKNKEEDGHPPSFDLYLKWLETVPAHPHPLPHCVDWKKKHGPLQKRK